MAITEINGVKGKTCSRCRQWRPLEFFHKETARRDGYAYYCKECCRCRRSAGASKPAKPTTTTPTPQKESPTSLIKRLDALASELIAKLIRDYPQVANDEYVEIYRKAKAGLERDQQFLANAMQAATSRGAYMEAKDFAAKLGLNVKTLIDLKKQYENENDAIVAMGIFKSVRDKIADYYDMKGD